VGKYADPILAVCGSKFTKFWGILMGILSSFQRHFRLPVTFRYEDIKSRSRRNKKANGGQFCVPFFGR